MPIAIALHGGAGTIVRSAMSPEKEALYRSALQKALHLGYRILQENGTALDAVEATVRDLEDCPLFNAGKGSVFTAEGTHEMDAAIMEGRHLSAGAVSLVSGVKNPVTLARMVMEKSDHVFMAGAGAMEFAKKVGCAFADDAYFFDQFRYDQWQAIKNTDRFQLDHSVSKDNRVPEKVSPSEVSPSEVSPSEVSPSEVSPKKEAPPHKRGTVGAVACDHKGDIAAATSTGGMTNKRWGRIGDSPVIGAGIYANNQTCAVSCTGSGEYFLRAVVAYDVSCLIEFKNYNLVQACQEVIQQRLLRLGGDGGLVAVNAKGEVSMPFNTEGMYRASKTPEHEIIAIYDR